MSWFSNLAEAYDRVAAVSETALLPQYHMIAKTDICITIDGNGRFLRAEESKLDICIPCTEDSSTRVGNLEPHALHEQLGYLALDEKKRSIYLQRLALWSNRHSKVRAVNMYVESGHLLDDLRASNIINDVYFKDEVENKKTENNVQEEQDKNDKLFVRFRVEIPDDTTPNVWEDIAVIKAWQTYCEALEKKEQTLCYATGIIAPPTVKHPKGTNMSRYDAKLISCNDKANYTYRGRFRKPEQANAISMEASHKAHAMLKYLIATQGYKCDTQAIVAWAVEDGDAQPDPFEDSLGLCSMIKKTERDKLIEAQGELAADYAKMLRDALRGKGKAENLNNFTRRVAVIAMDAATTGRMGITFYQDMPQNEYIERIIAWHESCCWWVRSAGHDYICAPNVRRIISAVYGELKGEGAKKIEKQARERLLHNIVCGEPLSRDWVYAAVTRASQPFSYITQEGGWDKWRWETALNVTCAIVRRYLSQRYQAKEEFNLVLDKHCTDRNYLFGRLMAIADRLESYARYLQKDESDKRPTNAVRYMSAFASKPLRTWKLIYHQLNPYIQRLNGAEWYQKQIDEIMSMFEDNGFSDKPLDGKYLLGYSLQRRVFMSNDKEEEINNDTN